MLPALALGSSSVTLAATPIKHVHTENVVSAIAANSAGDLFVATETRQITSGEIAAGEIAAGKRAKTSGPPGTRVRVIPGALLYARQWQRAQDVAGNPQTVSLQFGLVANQPFSVTIDQGKGGQTRPENTMSATEVYSGGGTTGALRFIPLSVSQPSELDQSSEKTKLLGKQESNNADTSSNEPVRGALYIASNGGQLQAGSDSGDTVYAGMTNLHRLGLRMETDAARWSLDQTLSGELNVEAIDGMFNVDQLITSSWETLLAVESFPVQVTPFWNVPGEAPNKKMVAQTVASVEAANHYLNRDSNPYRYGYIVEIADRLQNELVKDSSGNNASLPAPVVLRHYSTGRLPTGRVVLAGDNRTLYRLASESGILFRFVSDFPNNLAAGTLSVGRLIPIQQNHDNPYQFDSFNLQWIELGRGNNEEIAGWIADYEGMTAADYSTGETSYLSDQDITAWYEKHKKRHLNDTGDISQYIDSRVAFLEPLKAAEAVGANRQAVKVQDIALVKNRIVLRMTADTMGDCGELYAGAPDIEGNLHYISKLTLSLDNETDNKSETNDSSASSAYKFEDSICRKRFVLDSNEQFLPEPDAFYYSDGKTLTQGSLTAAN